MVKPSFDTSGVTATLINRVYRTGAAMMSVVDKNQKKSGAVDPKLIQDLEADYLLASIELESLLKTQLAKKNTSGWKVFVEAVEKRSSAEKLLYRGVVQNIQNAASNILAGVGNPFATQPFELPPYVIPYVPLPPAGMDPEFWKQIMKDAERINSPSKDVLENVLDGATLVVAAVAVAAAAPEVGVLAVVAAGLGAFTGGVHLGNAINDYSRQ